MISFLFRYGAVFFMVNTIFLSAYIFHKPGTLLFPAMMGIYALLFFIYFKTTLQLILMKPFVIFLIINVINLLHLIFLHTTFASFQYLITKFVIFLIISFSLFFNEKYYYEKFFKHFIYIGLFFAFASIIYSPHFSTGYKGIIGNRNEFGMLISTILGVMYLYKDEHTSIEKMLMLFLLLLILMSGSRNALIGVFLAWGFKNGITWKAISFIPLFLIAYYLLDYFQIETTINRISQEHDQLSDRRMEWYYAWKTFLNKFWTGYGLEHYAYIDQSLVPPSLLKIVKAVMAHNSYLAGLVLYGFPFAAIVYGVILYIIIPLFKTYVTSSIFKQHKAVKIYTFILSYTLISSIAESHMFGINAFHGFMFWFSIGASSLLYYRFKRGEFPFDQKARS